MTALPILQVALVGPFWCPHGAETCLSPASDYFIFVAKPSPSWHPSPCFCCRTVRSKVTTFGLQHNDKRVPGPDAGGRLDGGAPAAASCDHPPCGSLTPLLQDHYPMDNHECSPIFGPGLTGLLTIGSRYDRVASWRARSSLSLTLNCSALSTK